MNLLMLHLLKPTSAFRLDYLQYYTESFNNSLTFDLQIKVSVSSGGDCIRTYRPDIKKGLYNAIILNVKTLAADNLLFYLGSAKFVSNGAHGSASHTRKLHALMFISGLMLSLRLVLGGAGPCMSFVVMSQQLVLNQSYLICKLFKDGKAVKV